ncbi:MAG: PAS domain S-box protein [Gammaproteobacteria bacterium]|nr:PAS domain S-box protein [Gammaproteobacteria bacterium]
MKIHFPIVVSITALALLLLFLQASVLMYTGYREIDNSLRQEVKKELVAKANFLQGILEFLHYKNELEQVQEEITSLGSDEHLRLAVLINEKDIVSASTRIEYIGNSVDKIPAIVSNQNVFREFIDVRSSLKYHLEVSGSDSMYIMQPVVIGTSQASIRPDVIGVLVLDYDLSWIKFQVLASLVNTQIPVFLSLILLTGLFSALVYFLYIKRINKITEAAINVSKGNYSYRLDARGHDEIGFLGNFFNQMISSIEAHQNVLENSFNEIRDREQNLTLTLQSIGDAVIVTDAEGYITRMNPAACQLTAWAENEGVGHHLDRVFNIINSKTREPISSPVETVLKTGQIVGLANHTSLIDKQGKEYQIADSAAPIKDATGVIHGVIMVFQNVTRNYEMQNAMKASEQRLQLAMEATEEGLWDWNIVTDEVYYSPRWQTMLGYELGEIESHISSWKKIIHPDDESHVYAALQAHLSGKTEFYEAGHRLQKKDGSWFWVMGRGKVTERDDQGEPVRVVGIIVDISEKVIARDKENQRNEQMRNNQNALLEWAKVDYLDIEQAFRSATRLAAKNLQVDRVSIWLFSGSLDAIECEELYLLNEDSHEKGLLREQQDCPEYFKALLRDVVLVVEDVSNDPVCAELLDSYLVPLGIKAMLNVPVRLHGEVLGTVCCERINDEQPWTLEQQEFVISIASTMAISLEAERRRQTESILRRKETENRRLLDNLIDGVITIDQTGRILSFNPSAEKMFGYLSMEVIGQNVNLLMPEPYKKNHDDYIQAYLETGEARVIGASREVNAKRRNGEIFPMRLALAELPVDENNVRRFIASCSDVTQIKINEDQVKRAQKMDAIGKLTGGIAHDYNNMLGVILGYAELLEMQLSDNPKLDKYIKTILHAGERGKKLTRSLLAFSRSKDIQAEPTDINQLLLDDEHLLAKTMTAQVKLKLILEDNLWLSFLDKGDLEDAILNMCINGMHAMPGGGTLKIESSNEVLGNSEASILGLNAGEYVRLSLEDTGAGMNEDTRLQIFEPFYTTKGENGTGLGLSQVYGFVQRSKGAIRVYSELEKGTRFTLYFPRYQADQLADIKNDNKKIDSCEGNETILVVDDEQDLRDLAREILSQHGYQVIMANDARHALEILETDKIDLLLTDVIMPGMNGYELADEVSNKFPHVKIQIASGFNDGLHQGVRKESLYKDLLHKPFTSIKLLEKIRRLLDQEE